MFGDSLCDPIYKTQWSNDVPSPKNAHIYHAASFLSDSFSFFSSAENPFGSALETDGSRS